MTWEQWTIAILVGLSLVASISRSVNSTVISDGAKVVTIVIDVLLTLAYVLVLHSGGFW